MSCKFITYNEFYKFFGVNNRVENEHIGLIDCIRYYWSNQIDSVSKVINI